MNTMIIKKSKNKDTWWLYDFDKDNQKDMDRLYSLLKEEGRRCCLVQTTNRTVSYVAFR